ncbi:MAG: hypothetical protein II845_02680 [Oscillospiraceae bacterium]|nr:hypothetical protein [Oscillospiraceae bacterium]
MKKTIALLLALIVVLSLTATAFAAGTGKDTDETTLENQVNETESGSTDSKDTTLPGTGREQGQTAKPENGRDNTVPEKGDRTGMMNGRGGKGGHRHIDFEAMVEEGVISQETYDKIMAWLEEKYTAGNAAENNGTVEREAQTTERGGRPTMKGNRVPGSATSGETTDA